MNNLIRLINVPVPPMLELALGYDGGSRHVAFYWEPAGDELAWEDGRGSRVGANWHAWLTFVRHPRVSPHLDTYELGSSDEPARHWLLLDRQARALYVSKAREVASFLAQHAPPAPAISIEQVNAFMRQALGRPLPDPAEIQRRMTEQNELVVALEAWLNQGNGAPGW